MVKRLVSISIVVIVLCSVVPFGLASADEDAVLLVQPGILELHAAPGSAAASSLTVSNETDQSVHYEAGVLPAVINEGVPPDYRSHYDVSSWMTVSPASFTLTPGKHRSLVVQVAAPPDAGVGGYYGTVFVKTVTQTASEQTQLQGQIGSRVLFTVDGPQTHNIELDSVQARQSGKWNQFALRFTAKNNGTVHELLRGTLVIRDFRNEIVERQNISQKLGTVFPHTSRTFQISGKVPWPGRYKAEVVIEYGEEKVTASRGVLWLYPAWIQWLTLAAGGGLLGLVVWAVKRRRRSLGEKPESPPSGVDEA